MGPKCGPLPPLKSYELEAPVLKVVYNGLNEFIRIPN